jgi:hypothetical protein
MSAGNGRHPETDVPVQGYCVYCRARQAMHGAIQVCTQRGGRALKGHCAVCGKPMYRLGGWDSIAAAAQKTALRAAQETGAPGSSE